MNELLYKIALTMLPLVGSVTGKNLVAYCGGVIGVFTEKKRSLLKIPGIGEQTVNAILNHNVLERAEEELLFIEKNKIKPLFYLDEEYPDRLKQCIDSPLIIYSQTNVDLNADKVIAFVGTRNATEYGKDMCKSLIEGLVDVNPLIVSGLAYGIDTYSHKAALENHLPTVAILGHGLDMIYPYTNRGLAEKMKANGGLISEFMQGTKPDYMNFPKRNRIIAGMSDAVVVVEAGIKGGALITAEIANNYNRDVFAVPGRVNDPFSAGCNNLIRNTKAALVQSADDIRYIMNWNPVLNRPKAVQKKLFIKFTDDEQAIVDALNASGELTIDGINAKVNLLPSKAASALLNLEFEGVLKCLPGKLYKLT
jgi:DNA processing protein